VIATRPPSSASLAALRPSEFATAIVREAGFSAVDAMQAVTAMANLVIGFVLAEVGLPPGVESDVDPEEWASLFRAMTPEEFPNILEALEAYEFDFDRQFEFGLNALMRGLEPLRETPEQAT
jgi:hypothetical protein